MVVGGELNATISQLQINMQEARHPSVLVAGWRPFIGWVCGLAMFSNFIVTPYVSAFSSYSVPTLDWSVMSPVLMVMLGLVQCVRMRRPKASQEQDGEGLKQ